MLDSIPYAHWQVHADDPLALTKVLDLPDLIVTGLEADDTHRRLIVFCTHAFDVALCPTCRTLSSHIHEYSKRCVRDLAWSARTCHIEFAARRFYCETCECPFREELPWLPRCSRLTKRYREFVFAQCQKTTIQAVHQKEGLGYKTVERLYYAMAQQQAQPAQTEPVKKLGIDEFAIKKGHDSFALALSDLEAGRVLAVLADRKKETLEVYLRTWSDPQRAGVLEAAMDLWEPYAQAVSACLPNARIVADRFHVMKNLNDQVTAARREIQRSLPQESKQTLKGCRWLLVRNHEDLSPEDKGKLEAMFAVSASLKQLHGLKEDFRAIFEADLTPEEAAPKLERWMAAVQSSGLTKLSKFVSTLKNRFEHVLNYFRHRLTSGMVEGLNNKVKVIKRCAYGFGNFEHFALRILVECDGTA
jgi:transposase